MEHLNSTVSKASYANLSEVRSSPQSTNVRKELDREIFSAMPNASVVRRTAREIQPLPFSNSSTFTLREREGFNKQWLYDVQSDEVNAGVLPASHYEHRAVVREGEAVRCASLNTRGQTVHPGD